MNTILHIDINAYFATLLQQENPFLRGKPLGIVKDYGRTCIIAASKEAKQHGVRTGSSVVDARLVCPQIQLIPAEFELYLDATKRLKILFESLAPKVEIYSLDEAFVDISNCRQLYSDSWQLAHRIQTKIKKELGDWVSSNVGISYNRFLAKLAAEISPKGSIFEINSDNLDFVLAEVGFDDVCGVGPRLSRKLALLNVHTPYQLRFYEPADLKPLVGKFWACELLKIAYGEEPHFLTLIDHNPYMKGIGRSITGFQLISDESSIKRILYNLTEEVTYKLRKMDLAGRLVCVTLFGHDHVWGKHRTVKYYIRHSKEMFAILYYDLYSRWQRNFPIIKFAVHLGLLEPMKHLPHSLLFEYQKQEDLSRALDQISDKYGLFTAYSGLLHNHSIIRPEVTGFLGDKQYQFS